MLAGRKIFQSTLLYVVLAVLAGGGGVIWSLMRSDKPSGTAAIITATVEVGNVQKTILATGVLEPYKLVSVGAQTSGRVTKLNVELGQYVREGDLIAEIESSSQQNALDTASAKIASVKAQIDQARAVLKESDLSYQRQKELYATLATSHAELDAAEAAYNTARASLKSLEAQLAEADITRKEAELNLQYTKITSPISGNILAIVTKEGQTINSNQTTPTIVKVGLTDKMLVKAEISEADVIHVAPGAKAYFTILGDQDRTFEATLGSVALAPTSIETTDTLSPSTNANAIYYNGLFNVDNSDGTLKTFMTAQINIVLQDARNVLTMPTTGLGKKTPDGRYQVKVVDSSGKISVKSVKIGVNDGTHVAIMDGLKQGEKVVIVDATNRTLETDFKGPPRVGGL